MPLITNSLGEELYYDPHWHSYADKNGKKFDSVTRLVASCFEPFDKDRIALKIAEQRGTTKEKILDEWSLSAAFGTKIHSYAEALTNSKTVPKIKIGDRKEILYRKHVTNWLKEIKKEGRILAAEVLVFDPKYRVAGIVDGIFLKKESGQLIIFDWKTNKKFSTESHWGKGLGALSHLQDCHLVKYSLQLNLYRYLLLRSGNFKTKNYGMEIWHVDELDGVVVYNALELQAETEIILKREMTQGGSL